MNALTARDIAEQLAKLTVPYFTICLGDETNEVDVEFATGDMELERPGGNALILDVEPAEYAMREQRFRITVEEVQ